MKYNTLKRELDKPIKFSKTEIQKNIFLLKFRSQRDLCLSFLRFQEFYESPKFADNIFSHWNFYNYYKKEKGSFSYHRDWFGFNIPSSVLRKFYEVNFHRLKRKELQIIKAFEKEIEGNEKFYVIGIFSEDGKVDIETLNHEIAHALYFMNKDYKKEIQVALKEVPTSEIQHSNNFLKEEGYHKKTYKDELHAYTLFGLTDLYYKEKSIPKVMISISKKLQRIFYKYRN